MQVTFQINFTLHCGFGLNVKINHKLCLITFNDNITLSKSINVGEIGKKTT